MHSLLLLFVNDVEHARSEFSKLFNYLFVCLLQGGEDFPARASAYDFDP